MRFLVFFYLICIDQSFTRPNRFNVKSILCRNSQTNCTAVPNRSSVMGYRFVTNQSATTYQTTTNRSIHSDFTKTLRVVAMVVAGIALGLGIIRFCLLICKRPIRRTNNRQSGVVRPQVAVIEVNSFKPDLPPPYAEAMEQPTHDTNNRLPSYHELQILSSNPSPTIQA